MPHSVLTRGRKMVARLTALAMVASIMVIGALPASAAPIDTSATCPSSTPSAGFVDIAAYSAAQQLAINCLADYEIAIGTSATTYSPQMDVSRWQMALFLTRQAEVHGLTLPSGASQGFTDIGAYPASTQVAINQLAQLDITMGTTATTYSPADPVSRWQMALFLTRLLDAAGYTLGNGVSQGFTDIGAYPASTQIAINQIAQAGVAEGFTATTFGPGQITSRVQMALFLTRTLAADNVVPAGQGFVVLSHNGGDEIITYDDNGTSRTVDYTPGTGFFVDGVAATRAAFAAAISTGDLIAWSGTVFRLTNVSVTGGLLNDVDIAGQTYDIVLPTGATIVDDADYTPGGQNVYMVDGVSTTVAGFEADINNGDTLAISGAGTVASPRMYHLTNQTVTGTATAAAGPDFSVRVGSGATLGVYTALGTDNITVGGTPVLLAAFNAALTNGDSITYSRKGGVATIALTNNAPTLVVGEALWGGAATNVVVAVSGTSTVTLDWTADNDGGAWDLIRVNGAVATVADFAAALTPGDVIRFRDSDAATSTSSLLELVNAPYSGTAADIDTVAGTLSVYSFGASGVELDTVEYDAVDPDLGLTLGVGGVLRWQVNGSSATMAQFETAVAFGEANFVGNVSVTKVGNDIVWNATTS